jgi:hypothetical protein
VILDALEMARLDALVGELRAEVIRLRAIHGDDMIKIHCRPPG